MKEQEVECFGKEGELRGDFETNFVPSQRIDESNDVLLTTLPPPKHYISGQKEHLFHSFS